jgi:polyhydroxyalkanoate synthesis repressor PhaR
MHEYDRRTAADVAIANVDAIDFYERRVGRRTGEWAVVKPRAAAQRQREAKQSERDLRACDRDRERRAGKRRVLDRARGLDRRDRRACALVDDALAGVAEVDVAGEVEVGNVCALQHRYFRSFLCSGEPTGNTLLAVQHRCRYGAGVAPPVVIKKYGNRRLYDTGESRYVTLEELAAKIRGGADVRVVDANTADDLTQATLTQIVLESGNAAKVLPVQLLTQMIRLSDDALAEFFSRYVTGALDLYLNAKRGVQSIAGYNPLTQLPLAATDALTRLWMGYQQPPGYGYPPPYVAPPPEEPAAEAPPADRERERDGEVAAMRRELDELKQAIREGLAAKPAPRKKRKS